MDRTKELVEYVAKSLVTDPEGVVVNRVDKDNLVVLELRVAPDDMGRVIGKQGRIAKAIRTLVRSATSHSDKKHIVEILD